MRTCATRCHLWCRVSSRPAHAIPAVSGVGVGARNRARLSALGVRGPGSTHETLEAPPCGVGCQGRGCDKGVRVVEGKLLVWRK